MATGIPPEGDPFALSQYLLDVTADAYRNRCFKAFSKWFHTPMTLGTFEGDRILKSEQDHQAVFDAMCAYFDRKQVIEMHRDTVAARFLDQDTVQYTFVSQYVLPGHVLGAKTVAYGVLRRIDGQWGVSESRYASQEDAIMRALQAQIPGAACNEA